MGRFGKESRDDGIKDGEKGKEDNVRSLYDDDYREGVNEGEGIRDRGRDQESVLRSVFDKDYARGTEILQDDLSSDYRESRDGHSSGGSSSSRRAPGNRQPADGYSGPDYSGGGGSGEDSSLDVDIGAKQIWASLAHIASWLSVMCALEINSGIIEKLPTIIALIIMLSALAGLLIYLISWASTGLLFLILLMIDVLIFNAGKYFIFDHIIISPTIYIVGQLILLMISIIFLIKSSKG